MVESTPPSARRDGVTRWLPEGADVVVLALVLAGFALLYLPTYYDLSHTVWASDEQGHGPIILGVSLWLLFQLRHTLAALPADPRPVAGGLLFFLALLLYVLGRTQAVIIFEVGSQIATIASLLLLFKGPRTVRLAWFPLFFLLFMVPLPGSLVAAVTTPLKAAVSYVAEVLMYQLGYPIARSGVVLHVGQYQLLVADACAGLNSMFTLEALGLLYMNLMGYTSVARNVTLAVLVIPIAFVANVIRVMVLILVTYHFGDEAGQGFVHEFAGMVLFLVGLMLMLATDKLLGLFIPSQRREKRA
ncbi:MAG: exosortase B [Burkholderiaceae bacterium]|nr:exosortase B [Burkholderiaceae bacterium]